MTHVDDTALLDYLTGQRWYAGTGEAARIERLETLPWLTDPATGSGVRMELVTVVEGSRQGTYQLPLVYRREPERDLDHAFVGTARFDDEERYAYDALADPTGLSALLAGFVGGAGDRTLGGLTYRRLDDDPPISADSGAVPLVVEQSNSSVVVDETAMLKIFRRLAPGRNPDIEVLAALASDYADIVPRLHGWIRTETYDLGLLQAFLRTATEGWESAQVSVRDLLADPGQAPEDAGGDFAGEAERLGTTTRAVHEAMVTLLDTGQWETDDLAALADRMTARFEDATDTVPELAAHRDAVLAAYEPVRTLPTPVPVQRIHGDLHLGQTLRTSKGWKLIDFEGEPARPLAERTALESPMRDVAGMLRSFDYAAQAVRASLDADDDAGRARARAAGAWSARNREAFLRGYGAPASDAEAALLRAYEVDKTVYEAVYETLHRPAWLHIPLRALP